MESGGGTRDSVIEEVTGATKEDKASLKRRLKYLGKTIN
jgi:hypothetical protein